MGIETIHQLRPVCVDCKRNYGEGPCNRGGECERRNICLAVDGMSAQEPTDAPIVNLDRLGDQIGRSRLAEMAVIVRALTYGEMMELAAALWKVRPDKSDATAAILGEADLPGVIHRWSVGECGGS